MKILFELAAWIVENAPVEEKVLTKYKFAELMRKVEDRGTTTIKAGSVEVSHIAAPAGQPVEHYCLDCASKHLGTAKILLREALQWAQKGEDPSRVLAKIRGAYEELMGAEDDTLATKDEGIRQLNTQIRDLRKWMFNSGILVEADVNRIAEAFEKVSQVNDQVYGELEKRKEKLLQFIQFAREKLERLEKEVKESAEQEIPRED